MPWDPSEPQPPPTPEQEAEARTEAENWVNSNYARPGFLSREFRGAPTYVEYKGFDLASSDSYGRLADEGFINQALAYQSVFPTWEIPEGWSNEPRNGYEAFEQGRALAKAEDVDRVEEALAYLQNESRSGPMKSQFLLGLLGHGTWARMSHDDGRTLTDLIDERNGLAEGIAESLSLEVLEDIGTDGLGCLLDAAKKAAADPAKISAIECEFETRALGSRSVYLGTPGFYMDVLGEGVKSESMDQASGALARALGQNRHLAQEMYGAKMVIAPVGESLPEQEIYFKAYFGPDGGQLFSTDSGEYLVSGYTTSPNTPANPYQAPVIRPGADSVIVIHEETLLDFRRWPGAEERPEIVEALAAQDPWPHMWSFYHELGVAIWYRYMDRVQGGGFAFDNSPALAPLGANLETGATGSALLEEAFRIRTMGLHAFPTKWSRESPALWFAECVATYLAPGNSSQPDAQWLLENDPQMWLVMRNLFGPLETEKPGALAKATESAKAPVALWEDSATTFEVKDATSLVRSKVAHAIVEWKVEGEPGESEVSQYPRSRGEERPWAGTISQSQLVSLVEMVRSQFPENADAALKPELERYRAYLEPEARQYLVDAGLFTP
jgi:hypothetical protein